MMAIRWRALARNLLFSITPALVLSLLVEGTLRISGYPTGRFAGLFPSPRGLYPASVEMTMSHGPAPYTVKTNSLGFRGPEVSPKRAPGSIRIATVGDSITDGFFSDNDSMWQTHLQEALVERSGATIEVLNCAHGGGSIDKELWILKKFVVPLRPDLVILTFVTNDIHDIRWTPRQQLLAYSPSTPSAGEGFLEALFRHVVTRSAFGEISYHVYLSAISASYRRGQDRSQRRYEIVGGTDFSKNAEMFDGRYRDKDGLILNEPFDQRTLDLINNYLFTLAEFVAASRAAEASVLFVYFPAYSQIYGSPSRRINLQLAQASEEMGIDFLDLTDAFQAAGREGALHLAPLDFHLNPRGNQVFAEAVAEHLSTEELPFFKPTESNHRRLAGSGR